MDAIDDVRRAVRLADGGKAKEAREALELLWEDARRHVDPLTECVLAHSIADLQDDPREELRWDLLALEIADRVTDERAAERDVPGGRLGLYPSLHLNLAEDYLKLGDRDAARKSVLAAGEHLYVLSHDAYGRRIRAGFERLGALLASAE